jgi:hypothetical protein
MIARLKPGPPSQFGADPIDQNGQQRSDKLILRFIENPPLNHHDAKRMYTGDIFQVDISRGQCKDYQCTPPVKFARTDRTPVPKAFSVAALKAFLLG